MSPPIPSSATTCARISRSVVLSSHGRSRSPAAIFVVLQDYISSQTENWMSFIGLFFVLVVLFFPRGVLGIIRRRVSS